MKPQTLFSVLVLAAAGCAFDVEPDTDTLIDDNGTEHSQDVAAVSRGLPVTGAGVDILRIESASTTEPTDPTDPTKPTPDPWRELNPTKPTPDPWAPDECDEEGSAEESAGSGTETSGTQVQATDISHKAQ